MDVIGMPAKKKKPMSQKERAMRAQVKKDLQAQGLIPPDKPRLNRKKFAKEVWEEFEALDMYTADCYLRRALGCMVGPEMLEVTPEEVGVLKLMKLAVEWKKFSDRLRAEGREQYTLVLFAEELVNHVLNL